MILRINIKIYYPWRLQFKIAFTNNVAPVASNYNDIKAVNEPTLCNQIHLFANQIMFDLVIKTALNQYCKYIHNLKRTHGKHMTWNNLTISIFDITMEIFR